jgi:poly(A) polymerase
MIKTVKKIIKTLQKNGHKAYLAGGCVRDELLGITPNDYDIATSALPDEVVKLFNKTISVGVNFGVIIILLDDIQVEVATFRKDSYGKDFDGRHPNKVVFSTIEEDVKRRDFTINGMYKDIKNKKIIDKIEGLEDLKNKTIRFIGNPFERIEEDKLRMLRAIRFAVKYDFVIDKETYKAIKRNSYKIVDISKERIRDEFFKMLCLSKPYKVFHYLKDTNLLLYILPEIVSMIGIKQPKKYHPEGDVYEHTLITLAKMDKFKDDNILLFAALLHDVGKPFTCEYYDGRERFNGHASTGAEISIEICKRFKLSKKETQRVIYIIENHMKPKDCKKMKKSTLKKFLANEYFNDILNIHKADCLASNNIMDNLDFLNSQKDIFSKEKKLPVPLISGKDLIELGLKPSKEFSKILNEIYEQQLNEEIIEKDKLMILLIDYFEALKL